MKQIKLPAKIKEGKLIFASMRNLGNALSLHEGKDVVITIARPTKDRTPPQNRYLWKVPYKMIAEETGDDVDSIHHYLTRMFLSEKTSGPIPIVRSTTKLTTKEFMTYVDNILKWAAEFLNIYIPLPSEDEYYGGLLDDKK